MMHLYSESTHYILSDFISISIYITQYASDFIYVTMYYICFSLPLIIWLKFRNHWNPWVITWVTWL